MEVPNRSSLHLSLFEERLFATIHCGELFKKYFLVHLITCPTLSIASSTRTISLSTSSNFSSISSNSSSSSSVSLEEDNISEWYRFWHNEWQWTTVHLKERHEQKNGCPVPFIAARSVLPTLYSVLLYLNPKNPRYPPKSLLLILSFKMSICLFMSSK